MSLLSCVASLRSLVQKYEGLTNKIIAQIGDKVMKNTATEGTNGVQKLANCFRCAETGSTTTTRQTTNTYVPSFQLPANQVAAAKALVPAKYDGLISADGIVQIYKATLDDLAGEFAKAQSMGLMYQPAIIKASMTTMADATNFKKRNAQGQTDNGIYAAQRAQATKNAAAAAVSQKLNVGNTPLMAALSADAELPDIQTQSTVPMSDVHGVNKDSTCDDDNYPTDYCSTPEPMFVAQSGADGAGLALSDDAQQPQPQAAAQSSPINIGIIIGAAAGGAVLLLLITAAVVKHRRNKQHGNTVSHATHDTTSKV